MSASIPGAAYGEETETGTGAVDLAEIDVASPDTGEPGTSAVDSGEISVAAVDAKRNTPLTAGAEEDVPRATAPAATGALAAAPVDADADETLPPPAELLQTTVSGLPEKITHRARVSIFLSATVTPAYGRTAELQMYQKDTWVTKQTVTLASDESATLSLKLTDDWWTLPSSSWRVALPATETATDYTSPTIAVTSTKYYQNPSQYVQIKNNISLSGGDYNLYVGYMGLKVLKVNQYFRIGNKYWPRYTATTKKKVKNFQKKKKLKATGVVDEKTWLKMGFSKESWYSLGAYVSPLRVDLSSTQSAHIEAMIARAYDYLGAYYVVGASGTPSQGADCSGLVMQALYAAGVSLEPISAVRHSKSGYEYESRNIWASKKLKTVAYADRKRGDLIFYQNRRGVVNHVAIYLGSNKVIESWPNKVVVQPVKNSHRSNIKGVKRVFN
ncbi:MAG: C40 family peptidase [Clostridiales Family XIII bacterium]|nr:C40 family peptidase [Clostridiales Family XIII bacterium]